MALGFSVAGGDLRPPAQVGWEQSSKAGTADRRGGVVIGGFDANFFPARDTAWIFRASIETVLGANR